MTAQVTGPGNVLNLARAQNFKGSIYFRFGENLSIYLKHRRVKKDGEKQNIVYLHEMRGRTLRASFCRLVCTSKVINSQDASYREKLDDKTIKKIRLGRILIGQLRFTPADVEFCPNETSMACQIPTRIQMYYYYYYSLLRMQRSD